MTEPTPHSFKYNAIIGMMGLPPANCTVIRDPKELSSRMQALYERCVDELNIHNPPPIIIVDNDAWTNTNIKHALGAAHVIGNAIFFPRSTVDAIEHGNEIADYVFCHEMGHIADFNRGHINRRNFMLGSMAVTPLAIIGGAYGGGKWAANNLPDDTNAALRIPAIGTAGLTGALAARAIVGYLPIRAISMRSAADEQAAEEGAIQVLGRESVLRHIVTSVRISMQTAPEMIIKKALERMKHEGPALEARVVKAWPSDLPPLSEAECNALVLEHISRSLSPRTSRFSTSPMRNGNYPTTIETLEAITRTKTSDIAR